MSYEEQLSAARFKAERDLARQECERLQARLNEAENSLTHGDLAYFGNECAKIITGMDVLVDEPVSQILDSLRKRLMPEGMEWLLDVWPKWSNGEYCKFGDWWTADKYGDYEPKQLRRLVFYTPEQLREWEQDEGDNFGYEWDFMRPSDTTYRPDKAEPPAPKALASDGKPLEVGQTVWRVDDGREFYVYDIDPKWGVGVSWQDDGSEATGSINPAQLTHQRPVLDADGKRIETGMDVWWVCEGDERGFHAERLHVESVGSDGLVECSPYNGGTWVELESSELHVRKPVLDADGVPIHEGDTVYFKETGETTTVVSPFTTRLDQCHTVECDDGFYPPEKLTHTKPEPPDSWKSVWYDVSHKLIGFHEMERRCKELAERSE